MVHANIGFLLERGRRADGFYTHRFDHSGEALDARADLYDQAFMLLALAYAGRALGRPELFAAAEELGDVLDKSWRLPNGGYFEGEIAVCPPYRQNPHMHLLECFIALHETTGAPRWRRDAEHIARLCVRSFFHSESGALLEYFDGELSPLEGDDGRIVEPGHCFEWAWLFERLTQWDASGASLISDGMARFARRHGVDHARGVAVNEVLIDGSIRNPAARLWPQTNGRRRRSPATGAPATTRSAPKPPRPTRAFSSISRRRPGAPGATRCRPTGHGSRSPRRADRCTTSPARLPSSWTRRQRGRELWRSLAETRRARMAPRPLRALGPPRNCGMSLRAAAGRKQWRTPSVRRTRFSDRKPRR